MPKAVCSDLPAVWSDRAKDMTLRVCIYTALLAPDHHAMNAVTDSVN
jgi:hypothetical protein